VSERHLKIVAGCDHNLMTASVGDDTVSAAPTLPGAAEAPIDPVTDLSVRMMNEALDALETAMFGGPLREVGR
jgi:hypothetical protein